MTGAELDRLIIAWLKAYYPGLAQQYQTWSLMLPATLDLDHALEMFVEAIGQHFQGMFYFYIPFDEACQKLHLETIEIPIFFYDAFGKEIEWKGTAE